MPINHISFRLDLSQKAYWSGWEHSQALFQTSVHVLEVFQGCGQRYLVFRVKPSSDFILHLFKAPLVSQEEVCQSC